MFFTSFYFRVAPIRHPLVGLFGLRDMEQTPGYLSSRRSGALDLPDCFLVSNVLGKNARKVDLL